jgi:hypothetical protein
MADERQGRARRCCRRRRSDRQAGPERQAAFARGIEQTVRFMNELLENGVVEWVPAKKIRRDARK